MCLAYAVWFNRVFYGMGVVVCFQVVWIKKGGGMEGYYGGVEKFVRKCMYEYVRKYHVRFRCL